MATEDRVVAEARRAVEALAQKDRMAKGLLAAFFRADTPEKAEEVRQVGCPTCHHAQEDERDALCQKYRCTLRDPAAFEEERGFLDAVTKDIFREPKAADPVAVAALNEHIASCGCATIGFWQQEDGHYRDGVNTRTLRGNLHMALVEVLAYRAGQRVTLHLDAQKQQVAVKQVQLHYDDWADEKVNRAADLRTDFSDTEIARLLGRSPRNIREKLGPVSAPKSRPETPPHPPEGRQK